MKKDFKIRDGMVLVKPEKKEESIFKIIVRDDHRVPEYKNVGQVVKVGGEGCPVKLGERIVFPMYAGQDLDGPAGKFLLMGFDSILAVVE